MRAVSYDSIKINSEKTITFALSSKRTGRTFWFKVVEKRSGVRWVYVEQPYRFIGWVRFVRGKLVIVRGHETTDADLLPIRAFQYFLDAAHNERHRHNFVVSVPDVCKYCGHSLLPAEDKRGVCHVCVTLGR